VFQNNVLPIYLSFYIYYNFIFIW